MNETPIPPGGLRRFFNEPFYQFLAIGFAIFLISAWLDHQRQNQANTINVGNNVKSYLENMYEAQFGYSPSDDILDQLIDGYIQDEVLFRDSLQVGLAQQDEIIRRRLIQKMEYLILDSEIQAEAPEGVLKVWYSEHIDDFQQPARISFKHIYFAEDADKKTAEQRATQAMFDNNLSGDVGDHFPLKNSYSALTLNEVARLFGQSEFSKNLFSQSTNQWLGPWQSGYGWHLVFIEQRSESAPLSFESVQQEVFKDWQQADQQQRFDQAINSRMNSYNINIEISNESL